MSSKLIKVTIAALIAAAAIAVFVFQRKAIEQLRLRNQQLDSQLAATQGPPLLQAPEATLDTNEMVRLRAQNTELMRLRGEVTLLRRENAGLSNRVATPRPKNTATPAPIQDVDAAWVQQVLNSPPAQQGITAGALRGKLLRREMTNISPSEMALQTALAQRQLNHTLERSPSEFADFQTAFIQGVLGLSDATKLQQIHDLIRQTYEQVVANGLDVASKPAGDAEAWVQRRFQLDRQATAAVEQLLTPDERHSFSRAFLGVMGVDLGVGVDKSNYPKRFLGPE